MRKQAKGRLRKALLLTTALLGLTALSAPSAFAEVVPAKWGEETWFMRTHGTLELETGTGEQQQTTICEGESSYPNIGFPGYYEFQAYNSVDKTYSFHTLEMACDEGTVQIPLSPIGIVPKYLGKAWYDTQAGEYFFSNSGFTTGATHVFLGGFDNDYKYVGIPIEVEFRNPGMETIEVENEEEEMEEVEVEVPYSRLVFDDTPILGVDSGWEVRATGTLTVDDGQGNPRTLSH